MHWVNNKKIWSLLELDENQFASFDTIRYAHVWHIKSALCICVHAATSVHQQFLKKEKKLFLFGLGLNNELFWRVL